MKLLFTLYCQFFLFAFSFSHPGVGIVKDKKGNIYYTDLAKIWKIKPGGTKEVVVHSVHSHEIGIDLQGNLYGEHLWYNGETVNTWGHYVWRLSNSGNLDTLVGPKEGFLDNFSFNRDTAGNMYWIQQWKPYRFKKRTPSGEVIIIAEKDMERISWMHVTVDGKIYFTDKRNLYQLDQNGKITLLSNNIVTSGDNTKLWGIWTDKQENVYVANLKEKKVIKVTPSGNSSILAVSTGLWFPLSGVFDDHNNLWLMEGNYLNKVRVRKIPAEELVNPPATGIINIIDIFSFISWMMLLLVLIIFGVKYLYIKKGVAKYAVNSNH